MSPAGFEPAPPKRTDLKSVALDHSAKDSVEKVRISFSSQEQINSLVCSNFAVRYTWVLCRVVMIKIQVKDCCCDSIIK